MTKPIEADLAAKGQILHRAIAADPACWLEFASRIKSKLIYREALIHAVGQFYTERMQKALRTLEPKTVEVLRKKTDILVDGLKNAQLKMISYFPPQLTRQLTVGYADHDNIGRSSYANDIFVWISVVVFRQFVSQSAIMDRTHQKEDMGYKVFSMLRTGGPSYLARDDLNDFYSHFPMTDKGKNVMESWLTSTKEHVKKFAAVSRHR